MADFVHQYNEASHARLQPSQLRVIALRSRKHAAAEISLSNDPGPIQSTRPDAFIAKHFLDMDKSIMKHERDVLNHAANAGVLVPRVLRVLDNFLVLEKVDGQTLMDLVNDEHVPLDAKHAAVSALGAWLGSFHAAFARGNLARRRGDANLRNFIYTPTNHIVGFDFEEATKDATQLDLHEIVDSLLQSDPGIFSEGQPDIDWKYDLCGSLFRSYAVAKNESPEDCIGNASKFVDVQAEVMHGLADIRGTSTRLELVFPTIARKLSAMIDQLLLESSKSTRPSAP